MIWYIYNEMITTVKLNNIFITSQLLHCMCGRGWWLRTPEICGFFWQISSIQISIIDDSYHALH